MTNEIGRDNQVNLSYSDPSSQNYVSVSGKAEIVRDKAHIDAKWSESLKTWFPGGKDDPSVALIRVHREGRVLGQPPNSTMLHLSAT